MYPARSLDGAAYDYILDLLPVGAMIIDSDLTIVNWNRTLSDWTGILTEDALHVELTSLFPNVAEVRYQKRLQDVFELGLPASFSAVIHKYFLPIRPRHGLAGDKMIQQTEVRLLPDRQDHVLITIQDFSMQHAQLGQLKHERIELLTAQNKLRNANEQFKTSVTNLKQSEARLETIMESASEGIVTIDTRGTVESFNKAAVGLFDYRAEEVIGQNVMMLMPSPHTEQHDQYLANYLRTGDAKIIGNKREVEGQRKDGTLFPMELNISEVEMDGSHLFTAIIRDLTEQKQMQCELAQAQKLESVGQLAAGIAHEINTPTQYVGDNTRFLKDAFGDLNTALDSFERLLQAAKEGAVDEQLIAEVEATLKQVDVEYLSEEIPQAIDQSLNGVERVAKIVRAMKEFSHPGSDEKSLVNLNEAIETTITVANNEWKYVAEVVTEFDPELPSVACLPGELNQVFLNLIVNAAHAIGDALGNDSTEKGTITVGTRRNGESVEVSIRDTGTGIPEDVKAKIFDPFFTTKQVGKGTGQGLAIARSVVVDKHGGTIDCRTEQGKGTIFFVRLPIHEEQQTQGAGNDSENACSIR